MRRTGLMLLLSLLALLIAGCGGGFTISDDSGGNRTDFEATYTALPFTPLPTRAPTAAVLPNPTDPLVIVLGGEFGNGGYWTWADIDNLLGVYAQYGAYETATADGQTYSGVPLRYLMTYARASEYAMSAVVFDHTPERYSFTTQQLDECQSCLLVLAPDNTITLVLPTLFPTTIRNVMRIDIR